ncbi:hypothetical protein [Acidiluteibacter ferrifornacis]|uniref:Uncharacterized protein n=1 Tax=Acidiluteibacter ferrifornacis TaxID=2692424 RepID=A0A6N9NNK5_9FLAO|nr:hypothetical protein [Acidiluteibacter ferrifornacis]NBG67442.1 hypothetical protein [Acidiluteibacter ferrifornacis]
MSTKHAIDNIPGLKNIKGICYSPAPSDDAPAPPQKFFDTDFTNSCFPLLWDDANSGRGDIKNLASMGVNFIHLYNWSVPPAPGAALGSYQRSHTTFLKKCGDEGINVFIPISNYFLEQIHSGNGSTVKTQIAAMVNEAYNGGTTPYGGAAMWGIGNEYDLAPSSEFGVDDVVTAMEYLVDAEKLQKIESANLLPVTSPVSFAVLKGASGPGIEGVKALKTAIEASSKLGKSFWQTRFVASTNPNNSGSFVNNYIANTFPQAFPDTYFFFSEMGIDILAGSSVTTEKEQADYVLDQLNNTSPSGNFVGRCVFQFLDQTAMKSGSQATFGMNKFSGNSTEGIIQPQNYVPGGGASYKVDTLTKKPLYNSVMSSYNPLK